MRRTRERAIELGLAAAAAVASAAVLGILLFLAWFCLTLLRGGHAAEILAWNWRPFHGAYGILPMVAGSLLLSVSALALAFPVALGICSFAHGLGPPRLARLVMAVVHLMTGIPTIVYAFVSAMLLVPFVRGAAGAGSGYSLLTATPVLSVLILPTLVLLVHAYWQGVGADLRVTCAALGLTKAQELWRVLLPASWRGLAAAAILGFGRAVGDTMIALLLAGNAPQVPASPLDSFRALTAHIALVLATDSQDPIYASVFASGLILLLLTAGLSLSARLLHARARHAALRR
jgi:phosphate transport system permease protein